MSLAWMPCEEFLLRPRRRPVQYVVQYSGPYAGGEWRGEAADESDAETYAAEALMDDGLSFEEASEYVLPAEPVMRHTQR